ncbi:MAG: adenylosuccinate synthase [Planctomycetes bacterium]|nr:adenylosuccinate synthase [Planctomycetota bacterium]
MPVLSVIGAQWGDEGKGKILDLIASKADVVVRYQGGANAGHTVVVGQEKFVFNLLPSGILHPGKKNVIANGMVLDAAQLLTEIDGFQKRGIDLGGRLFVSAAAHLVFPYHKAIDRASEGVKGGTRIGTTGRGIGPCYADKIARVGLRVGDLYDEARFAARLEANVREKNTLLKALYGAEPLDFAAMLAEFRAYAVRLEPYVADTFHLLRDCLDAGQYVFIEGAQGMQLDIDFGTYPFVTSSNSSALGITAGTGIAPKRVGEVLGVAKAYTTRVGAGPFPTELPDAEAQLLRERGGEFGAVTGRPRRCGWFDGVAARFAVQVNGVDSLALTKLDTLSGYDKLRVCTGYEIAGHVTDRFPVGVTTLDKVKPRYETLSGWKEDVSGVRRVDDLPAAAREYVDFLEDFLRVRATILSVGPARDQTIFR